MSQDPQEIKTIEQWRWSEMQGLELVTAETDGFKGEEDLISIEIDSREAEYVERVGEATENRGGKGRMEASEGNKDGGEKPSSSPPPASFGMLFRFADGLDYVLMGIGTVGAIVHGCSLPLFLRFFADLVNSFGSNANNPDKMMQEVLKVMTGNQLHSKTHLFFNENSYASL